MPAPDLVDPRPPLQHRAHSHEQRAAIAVTVFGPELDPALRAGLEQVLGACSGAASWDTEPAGTAPEPAWRWSLREADLAATRTALTRWQREHHLEGAVEVAALPCSHLLGGHGGAPHLVVLDVDSTLIEQEVIDLLADRVGCQAQVAAITEQAMAGALDFAASLRERVALLAGLPQQVLGEVSQQISLTPGAATLVSTLKAAGHRVVLASGGFTAIIAPLAQQLGVDAVAANRFQISAGMLSGQVEGAIVDRAAKAAVVRESAQRWDIASAHTVAIGDGANDAGMLAAAGTGIAFCAKPALREVADVVLHVRDLAGVLTALASEPDADPPGEA